MTTAIKTFALCLLLCGCAATPTAPPLPPLAQVLVVTPPNYALVAYFAPGNPAWQAFFSVSLDMTNWQVLATYPYPVSGAWITNVISANAPQSFFRAGVSAP